MLVKRLFLPVNYHICLTGYRVSITDCTAWCMAHDFKKSTFQNSVVVFFSRNKVQLSLVFLVRWILSRRVYFSWSAVHLFYSPLAMSTLVSCHFTFWCRLSGFCLFLLIYLNSNFDFKYIVKEFHLRNLKKKHSKNCWVNSKQLLCGQI